jgi:AraC family transcriptional regulator, arabinose operon regulatory protein
LLILVLGMMILDFTFPSESMPQISQADYFSTQVVRNRRFFRPDWQVRKSGTPSLRLVGGGCEWCAADFLIERQSLPFRAFEFVARGHGHLVLGGVASPLSAGHAFFYEPGVPHRISSSGADPLVKYFFNFTGRAAAALFKELDLGPARMVRVSESARVVALLDEGIDQSLRTDTMGERRAAMAIGHAILLCLDGHQPASQPSDPSYETYLRCRGHLLRNYMLLATIEEAAGHCGISAPYFSRLFQRFDTETPLAFLTRLKLSQALLLLREPGAQVKQVAAQLGYRSAAHFSRSFKAWHHQPPQAVRDR